MAAENTPPARPFRFNANKIGLTYSCPVAADDNPITDKGQILDVLESVSVHVLKQWLISKELHENGKRHWHVFAKWDKRLDINNSRAFDCMGVHPNILTGINANNWCNYCAKKGDFSDNFGFQPKQASQYSAAIDADTVEEGMQIIAKAHPRDYVLQRDRIRANLQAHRASLRVSPSPTNLSPWNEYGESVREQVLASWTTKAIVLHGHSGVGKTALAKSMGTHPYLISHLDQLKNIPPTATHLILDDMSFGHLPRESVLHLVDLAEDRAIHCRYAVAMLHSGLKRILTTNRVTFLGKDEEGVLRQLDPAIARRVRWLDVEGPLCDGIE